MILKNPTQNEVKIFIKGEWYEIPAGGEVFVTKEIGDAWLKIHQFLQKTSDAENVTYAVPEKSEAVETPTVAEKPQIDERPKEETPIIEEKPKRGRKSTK